MADRKAAKGKNTAGRQTVKKGTANTKKSANAPKTGGAQAAGKKGTGSKESARRTEGKSARKQELYEQERLSASMKEEIVLAVTLLVSILFFLSYINLCGNVGNVLNTVIFGLIGIFGYLFPFLLFFGVAFGISNRKNRSVRRRLVCAGIFFACLTALVELAGDYDPELKWTEYFTLSAKSKNGGGILGGTLVRLLCPLFDTVATIVILIVIMLICLMLMTGRELFSYLRRAAGARVQARRRTAGERDGLYSEREEAGEFYEEPEYTAQRARVITLQQKGNAQESAAEEKAGRKREEPIRFVDALKARGKKGKTADAAQTEAVRPAESAAQAEAAAGQPESAQALVTEVVPEDTKPKKPEPTITGAYQPENVLFYEEELKRKFGAPKEDTTTVERNFYDVNVSERGTTVKENDVILIRKELFGDEEPQESISADAIFANAGIEPAPDLKEMPMREHAALQEETADAEDGSAAFADTQDERDAYRAAQETAVENRETQAGAQAVSASGFWPDMSVEPEAGMTPASGQADMRPVRTAAAGEGSGRSAPLSAQEKTAPMQITQQIPEKKYQFPPIDLLAKPVQGKGANERELKETAAKLENTLQSFGVRVNVTNISCGPAVTQYELQLEQGVKVNQITKLSDDIKLNLAATDIRIEAPIPGKAAVGIEVPNKENSPVVLRELLESAEFKNHKSKLAFAVGKNISGQIVVSDIAKMPHMLIAGATGSGKSVCINTIIMSILYKADPKDVRLIMVDPKVVELSVYNGIPHLLIPVVTDPKKASAALNWAVAEMTDRYQKFAALSVRDLNGYNEKVAGFDEPNPAFPRLPQIVIIVDELADLMMVASANEVEDAICRLAQMARAAGLHLIIATQRPSVNVITGVIKANVPSRVAFAVTSAVDSRTILDGVGAERLLGKGDMLFFPSGYPKPVRIQGAFVSDAEVSAVVDFLKEQTEGMNSYNEEVSRHIMTAAKENEAGAGGSADGNDDYFAEAGKFIIEKQKASIGMLQRVYKIGFNRAARIMDQLTAAGVVGPEEGTKPRKILMTLTEFEEYLKTAH